MTHLHVTNIHLDQYEPAGSAESALLELVLIARCHYRRDRLGSKLANTLFDFWHCGNTAGCSAWEICTQIYYFRTQRFVAFSARAPPASYFICF